MYQQPKQKSNPYIIIIIIVVILLSLNYNKIGQEISISAIKDGSEFNGHVMLNNSIDKNKVTVSIPSNYEDVGVKGAYIIQRKGSSSTIGSSCSVEINDIKFKNINNFIQKYESLYQTKAAIKSINGTTWYYVKANQYDEGSYYTEYKNRILEITPKISPSCEQEINNIIQSVRLK